ncbi:AGE family epimerase/isomerase [candidate division KSB1 bacterium]|nr:AGE family epimerase/isomerase [candidate division KSB1 bacterium]
MKPARIKILENQYREALLEDVIPFWEMYSIDRENGGYFTCLERDGSVYDTDKYMWLQGRQIWTFSMLYNQCEKIPEWLEIAEIGVNFLKKYGRNADGDWYFALDKAGKPLVDAYNIFSDCFVAMGFAEYYGATGDETAKKIALDTYWRIQQRKNNPKGRFNKIIIQNRQLSTMSFPMILLGMTSDIAKWIPQPEFDSVIEENLQLVMSKFVDEKLKIVFETIAPDGSHPDNMLARLLIPGHALEAMWFVLEIAALRNDLQLMQKATNAMLWTIERGWDEKYGGIFYFMDAKGFSPEPLEWDMKLWWVHLEALVAFALAHALTGKSVFEQWYEKIHDYAWTHFPDPEYGEWYGYLNRHGEVTHTLKGGKWKGCFHVPRALFICAKLFANMQAEAA